MALSLKTKCQHCGKCRGDHKERTDECPNGGLDKNRWALNGYGPARFLAVRKRRASKKKEGSLWEPLGIGPGWTLQVQDLRFLLWPSVFRTDRSWELVCGPGTSTLSSREQVPKALRTAGKKLAWATSMVQFILEREARESAERLAAFDAMFPRVGG